jgi:hypothetical protein
VADKMLTIGEAMRKHFEILDGGMGPRDGNADLPPSQEDKGDRRCVLSPRARNAAGRRGVSAWESSAQPHSLHQFVQHAMQVRCR